MKYQHPVNLQLFLNSPENRDLSEEQQALMLRRNLLLQINRHRQSITGPMRKSIEEVKESILTNQRLKSYMDLHAEKRNIPLWKVRKKADAYLDEIAAKQNAGLLRFAEVTVGWILNTMFQGVSYNEDGLNRVKTMAQKGPLVFVPCHKSHVDYLMLPYLMYIKNMPVPLIAAGKNLSFWPMGPVFRALGAFFLRRTFKGNVLYAKVFGEYIHKLLEEGFNLKVFIEGTRSRTGKLIMPKLGFLSILLNAYKNGACEDLVFAPVYIGYDRVLEEKSYLHEVEGGKKEDENFLQVLNARKFLKNRYGKIYIKFNDPISLNTILAQDNLTLAEMSQKDQNALCRNLGHRIINAINTVTVVTPHALVASALLNSTKKLLTYKRIAGGYRNVPQSPQHAEGQHLRHAGDEPCARHGQCPGILCRQKTRGTDIRRPQRPRWKRVSSKSMWTNAPFWNSTKTTASPFSSRPRLRRSSSWTRMPFSFQPPICTPTMLFCRIFSNTNSPLMST